MTELKRGSVVFSLAGHDRGSLLTVVEILPDGMLLLADGKRRKLSAPKRKKANHVKATHAVLMLDGLSDRALNKALRALRETRVVSPNSKGGNLLVQRRCD